MKIKKIKKICIYLLILFLIFSPIVLFSKNGRIEKGVRTSKNNELKALDQEGQTYRLFTSADNVQVPVPKGYVASNVTGENYVTPEYSHTQIPHKGNYVQLNWSSPEGEQYPWTQDENGIWISGNQGIASSTSTIESEEFEYIKGTTITIKFTVSCKGGDFLNLYFIDLTTNTTTIIRSLISGNTNASFDYLTSTYTVTMNDWGTGRYKIRAIYSKDSSKDEGKDSGYIKPSTYFKEDENGETIEIDQKTKIHDGGFVIYQLTDAELETDPNGTNIIINDTNKDEEQATRNQYVWVPVPNIEDITRTKTANNGIMQFGQNYKFSNTSITKETSTNSNYFKEPRLVENYDKTKYYLQKYSYIDKKRENFLNNMQEDFTNMIKSINKYKGFYIGRYETGDEINHNNYSITCIKNPKVVRYNSNTHHLIWYESYKDLKKLSGKTEKNVETGMIYDSIWDYTLKWLNDTDTRSYEDINKDSGTWGNYENNILKYKESANGTEITKDIGSEICTPTGGITEITYKGETFRDYPTSSNNIFDIAGNVDERTKARGSSEARGGHSSDYKESSNSYPSSRIGIGPPISIGDSYGVRAQLYIL